MASAWAKVRHNPWSTVGCVALALSVAACVALIPVYHRQSVQAQQGQMARDTQCKTFPVAIKLYTAGERYHLITADDLATYLAAAPRGCPTP